MKYDKNKYKAIRWTNWQMIHWILNPGLAINELFLGQRVPKVLLVEKNTIKGESGNRFVPCPHCGNLHDEKLWSQQNAFRNWFGLYCPTCGKTIPCIRNLTSLLLIITTCPIWIWFVKKWKQKWLESQPQRFVNIQLKKATEANAFSLIAGLSFGGVMYIISSFINPLITGEEISLILTLIDIPVWIIGGLCFGYAIRNLNLPSKIDLIIKGVQRNPQ